MRNGNGFSPADEAALIAAVRGGSQEAFAVLAAKQDAMLTALARQLVVPALEEDDLKQEGLLALLTAAKTFDPQSGASFATYARLCARHRMISARRRVMALPVPTSDEEMAANDLPDGQAGPERLLLEKEEERRLFERLKDRLSPLEYGALRDYLDGYSYEEIAAHLGATPKSVDNALSRARRKLQNSY